jgi:probable HAF family extracellular repeat protein
MTNRERTCSSSRRSLALWLCSILGTAPALLTSCGPVTDGEMGSLDGRTTASSALISDAVHSKGTPGFFFLPPIAGPARYGKTTVHGLSPVVVIEEVGGRGTIATFTRTSGPDRARVKEDCEHDDDHREGVKTSKTSGSSREGSKECKCQGYSVLWDVDDFHLKSGRIYRIHVRLNDRELGFAEAKMSKGDREGHDDERNGYVPLSGHSVLIAFRIEPAALAPPSSKCSGVVCAPLDQCHVAGTCDPASGACSNPVKANGSACSDGNACTLSDTCQAGACVGGTPITCAAPDQCHEVGSCNPSTGFCSSPNKPDGTVCNDGNPATGNDVCRGGVCGGVDLDPCTALDQCHVAGVRDPATGLCSNPTKANGASCNDGNTCTQADTCQAGACVGASPVTCAALDECHVAGACNSTTGLCTNPTKPDGSPCNDGNPGTANDVCTGGVCGGTPLGACTALDQCHLAGVRDPATGVCSNPMKANGASCNDGNACTQTDTCQAGTCVGQSPITCAAQDQCHVAGTCNPATGACSNPTKADGAACNDGSACTGTDTCLAGTCVGSNPVTCVALDQCHVAGSCNPATGICSTPAKADGASCSDGNACTQTDTCQTGACVGASPVVCTAQDACHGVGTCDSAAGSCSTPLLAEGTICGSGLVCTSAGTCIAACVPSQRCTPSGTPDACKTYATSCNAAGTVTTCGVSGNQPRDTPCAGGTCNGNGACVAPCTVTASDLGTLPGFESSTASAINASGQVVGRVYITDSDGNITAQHAFSWTQAGGMVDLGTLGGSSSQAVTVNLAGQVAGIANTAGDAAVHAFLWTQAGGMVDLGVLAGFTNCIPQAISSSGQVVGSCDTEAGSITSEHAFSWTQAGGIVDLGTLPGFTRSSASGVNDSGRVVGSTKSFGPPPTSRAFLWAQADGMQDLGTLPGFTDSGAIGINNSGQIIGSSEDSGVNIDAFSTGRALSWTPTGGMVNLATLPGYSGSLALALNSSGQVVGSVYITDSDGNITGHAFSWTQGEGMIGIGIPSGFDGCIPTGLSDGGHVVGMCASFAQQTVHAFSWTQAYGMVDLGPGFVGSGGPQALNILQAVGSTATVNASGQIIGKAGGDTQGTGHATLWQVSGACR